MNHSFGRFFAVAVVAATVCGAAHAQINQQFTGSGTYTGNAATGFGGNIGGSSLTLSYSAGTVSGTLTPSGTFSGNDLVLYLGTGATGVASTATFTDNADGGRTAISGFSGSGRTLASFPAGFRPSYAISIEPGNFAGLFNLSTPSNFGFVRSANLAAGTGNTLTFSFAVSDLGLTASNPNNIDFVGSLISTSGYRSNETIAPSVTTPGSVGDTPNAGFTSSQTFTSFNRLTTFAVVPEMNAGLLALLAMPVLGIARRKK